MRIFSKKKIYKVEYKDAWGDYGNSVVKAYDQADAWKRVRRQHGGFSPYRAIVCISIEALQE